MNDITDRLCSFSFQHSYRYYIGLRDQTMIDLSTFVCLNKILSIQRVGQDVLKTITLDLTMIFGHEQLINVKLILEILQIIVSQVELTICYAERIINLFYSIPFIFSLSLSLVFCLSLPPFFLCPTSFIYFFFLNIELHESTRT